MPTATASRTTGTPAAQQIEALTQASIPELLDRLGLSDTCSDHNLIRLLCWPPARHVAHALATYDQLVGAQGLLAGMEWLLRRFVGTFAVAAPCALPQCGPLLVVSNHPGLMDVAALLVSLGRTDVSIVAADRPFFRALPYTSRHLIYVSAGRRHQAHVLRTIATALRGGRAVLLFPAGRLEPDPDMLPGALESLRRWSPSIGHLVRAVPSTQIVPAIVRGVLSRRAWRHPLTRLRRQPQDRVRLAELLQFFLPCLHKVTVHVAYGPPLEATQLLAQHHTTTSITQAVVAEAARLVEQPPLAWQHPIQRSDRAGERLCELAVSGPACGATHPRE